MNERAEPGLPETGGPEEQDLTAALERRLGRIHARQRLGIERDYEARVFGHGTNFFHIENSASVHSLLQTVLKVTGLYWIGRRNAAEVCVRHNRVAHRGLPAAFDGFTILQISDLHVEMSDAAMRRAEALAQLLSFDICVLTGDYRALTYGPWGAAMSGVEALCAAIDRPIYGVLGNHDTIRMVPSLERAGIRLLLNETESIERDGATIHLAGVDDAHYYRVDNLEKVASAIPADGFSILLSHTPEIYRQAAHAGFDLMMSGHTHGGQICLPGGIPISLNARLPRRMGVGRWTYGAMQGYTSSGTGTSIVTTRFYCPPEITIHRLERC